MLWLPSWVTCATWCWGREGGKQVALGHADDLETPALHAATPSPFLSECGCSPGRGQKEWQREGCCWGLRSCSQKWVAGRQTGGCSYHDLRRQDREGV